MKKLISILAALAVVTTCSVSSMAADFTVPSDLSTVTKYEKATEGDNAGLYEVDLSSVAGDQEQTTILAVKGDTISVGSIEYIGQSADTAFNFDLRNTLNAGETVYVLAGGSDIDASVVGYMAEEAEDPEPTSFTVSGTVGNVVDQDFLDEMVGYVVDIYGEDEEVINSFIAAYSTTAYIVSLDMIEVYQEYYQGGTDSFDYIAKANVNTDGSYTFENVENGEYAILIERPSALPYLEYLTVDNEDVDIDEITLILGDLAATHDFMIEPGDVSTMIEAQTDIESEDFIASYDIITDCMIEPGDVSAVIENMSDISIYDTALIGDYF